VGHNPQDVLVDDAGRVHVLCTGTYGAPPDPEGSVWVLDPATHGVVDSVDLRGSPGRFALDRSGTVWVAGFSGGLRRYDAATLQVLENPADPVLAADGLSAVDVDELGGIAYVTSFDADLLLAVDTASLAVRDVWIVGDGPVDVRVSRPANGE
jgi:DNA-binding beta-propeller fold protein YncE